MPGTKEPINLPPVPRAPPGLLTTVKLVFSLRREAIIRERKEKAARKRAERYRIQDAKDAAIPVKPVRQVAGELVEALEAMRKPVPYIYRRPKPHPDENLTWAEVDRLMDEEVEMEVTMGPGLKRAEGETLEHYEERMRALELRLDTLISIDYFRQQRGPLRYMDGMPVSLIAVHRHVRPIVPPKETRRKPCLQCKVRGLPCSRTLDLRYGPATRRDPAKSECSRCRRNGDRCLYVWNWQNDDGNDPTVWKFAGALKEGKVEYTKEWLDKLNTKRGIKALPAWHENDRPENVRDREYQPKRWWNMLSDGHTEW
ncbi:hypothetical protein ACHAPT_002948 [Fusarium lateritium]